MLGVFTDQVFDTAAGTDANANCTLPEPGICGAGTNSAAHATAGVANLLQLALGPTVPCTNPLENPCVANVPGYDLFDAWASFPPLAGMPGELRLFAASSFSTQRF